MSYNCTLHPVDLRLAEALTFELTARERAEWDFFWKLAKQKSLLDQVNRFFKAELKSELVKLPEFRAEIHLYGRPFLIHANEPSAIITTLAKFYATLDLAELRELYLEEIGKFSVELQAQATELTLPDQKKIPLGLEQILVQFKNAYRKQNYLTLSTELPFVLAQLAGLSQPFWRTGQFGLSFLADLGIPKWENEPDGYEALFSELPELWEEFPQRLTRNLAGGIYLNPAEVDELEMLLLAHRSDVIRKMALKQMTTEVSEALIQKTLEALAYAKHYGLGLMEATDIFDSKIIEYP